MLAVILFITVLYLAYANGANDNFKGVASLYGSSTASYKTSLILATVTTFLGSGVSFFLANGLIQQFSGKGIVPDGLVGSEGFLFAVAIGAGSTVILATVTGFPISTTHGLTGAILGSGYVAVGGKVKLDALGAAFLLPLLISPFLAVVVASVIYGVAHFVRRGTNISTEMCVCVGNEFAPLTIDRGAAAMFANVSLATYTVDSKANCIERYNGEFLGISFQKLIDAGHIFSAGVVSFARGLNDTPKIAALLLTAHAAGLGTSWMLIGAAMAVGGWLNARKVAEKMSKKITGMNSGQAFSANLGTGLLVMLASVFGFPVSTTHVSVGSLFGIGLVNGKANPRVVFSIVLSWVITLPCAALLGGVGYLFYDHFERLF